MLTIFSLLSAVALVSAGYSSYDYGSYNSPDHQHNSHYSSGSSYSSGHTYDPAPLDHDGIVIDTPEVTAAKAAHFAAHAAAKHAALSSTSSGYGHSSHDSYSPPARSSFSSAPKQRSSWSPSHDQDYVQPKWNGPPAHIELTHDGNYIKDTPEVSRAKFDHFAAVAEISARSGGHDHDSDYDYHYSPSYDHGPYDHSPYDYSPSYHTSYDHYHSPYY